MLTKVNFHLDGSDKYDHWGGGSDVYGDGDDVDDVEGADGDDDDHDDDVSDDNLFDREGGRATGMCFTITNLFACLIYSFSKEILIN